MEAAMELEIVAGNLMNSYLERISQNPAVLYPLAETIAKDAKEIRRKFTRKEEQVEFVIRRLMNVMTRSLFVQDLFYEAVRKQVFTGMDERDLLENAEHRDFTSEVTSGDLWEILRKMVLDGMEQGTCIEQIYYDNYFLEYASNLLEIHLIDRLSSKENLMKALRKELLKKGGPDLIYQMFIKVTDTFKDELPIEAYEFDKALRMV